MDTWLEKKNWEMNEGNQFRINKNKYVDIVKRYKCDISFSLNW